MGYGNLGAHRDWGFAGDYVEGMWKMLQQEKPDDYIIATGEPHTLKEVLDEVFGYLDLDWHNYVEIDPRYFRATESTAMIGDSTKARTTLEWQPQTSFRELARIMTDADMAASQKLSTTN